MFEPSLAQLACPGQLRPCGGRLELRANRRASGANHPAGEDVVSGLLRCEACGQSYPIVAGIAVLLPDCPITYFPAVAISPVCRLTHCLTKPCSC